MLVCLWFLSPWGFDPPIALSPMASIPPYLPPPWKLVPLGAPSFRGKCGKALTKTLQPGSKSCGHDGVGLS